MGIAERVQENADIAPFLDGQRQRENEQTPLEKFMMEMA